MKQNGDNMLRVLIILVSFLLAIESLPAREITLHSVGKTMFVETVSINETEYVPFGRMASMMFASGSFDKSSNSFRLNDIELKVAASSFYVLYRTNEEMKVGQMRLPAIYFNEDIHVAVEPIMEALQSMELLVYDLTDKGLFVELSSHLANKLTVTPNELIRKTKVEKGKIKIEVEAPHSRTDAESKPELSIHNSKEPKANKSQKKESHKSNDEEIEVFQKVPDNYNTKIPANKYYIPKSLDRGNLKEIHNPEK